MSTTPATRSLPMVLRRMLERDPRNLTLVVGELAAAIAAPEGNAYVNVLLGGTTVRVPRLSGAPAPAGKPAYLLVSGDFMLYIGTVSTT